MRRVLSVILLCFLVSLAHAQGVTIKAIIERYDASFVMASQTTGTYKVNMRVSVLSKDAADEALFLAYEDGFKSLSSFSGFLESGGKVIKKYKMSDLKSVSVGEGGITDATVSYLEPVAPVPYVVEYTYEISYKDGFITFPSFIPVTEPGVILSSASYTLSVPPGTELMYKSSMEPEKETGAKADIYKWKAPVFQGYVYEHMMPSIFEQVPYLYVGPKSFTYARTKGEQTDWHSAGMWLYGLQKDACSVPDALRAKVEQITAGMSSDRQKIKALYEYLRQNTRYVSIQLGIGGLSPFPAEMVMNSGFGDCKALSVYMQALLAAAGIHSEYLIVNTGRRNLMKDFYSVGQMDHAMLCVPMQEDTLWIECTNPRLPLGYRHDNIAGHQVVLVTEDGGKMVRVRPYADSLSRSVESVEVTLNADGSAHCEGSRYLSLDEAEAYVGFEALSEKTKFNAIMGANSLNPSGFRIVSVEDNFDSWVSMSDGEEYVPETTIRYSFDAVNYAKVSGDRIFLNLNPFAKQVHSERKARVNDYVRSRELSIKDVVTVVLPEGYEVEAIPATAVISTQFGTLETEISQEDGKIHVVQTLTMNPGRFAAEEYEVYRTFAKDVSKAYSARIVLKKKD
jgi:transglutaminase-like putative cysteine protease